MKWLRRFLPSNDVSPKIVESCHDHDLDNYEAFGRLIDVGYIVRFRDSETDFDKVLTAGSDHMMDYFCDVLGGIRIGHIKELVKLGFFQKVSERVGRDVYVGVWQEIPPWKLHHVIDVLEEILPQSDMPSFPADVLDMCHRAKSDGCPIGIMLSDDRYVTMNRS